MEEEEEDEEKEGEEEEVKMVTAALGNMKKSGNALELAASVVGCGCKEESEVGQTGEGDKGGIKIEPSSGNGH